MHATIIGIDGGMGQWMKNHLTGLGYTVSGFDERIGDTPSILKEAHLVVVSVPIPVTVETIKKTVKHMKQGACLMEIASLKSGIHETMNEVSSQGFDVLCVHPMFGPSTESLEGKSIAVIPVLDVEHEKEETLRLFPGASIEVVEAEEHDRLMSIILSLPYLINLAFAVTLKEEDLMLLRRLSGSTFALQYTLAQGVVAEKTGLIAGIISKNIYLEETLASYLENIEKIAGSAGSIQFKGVHDQITTSMRKDPMRLEAKRIRQSAFDTFSRIK